MPHRCQVSPSKFSHLNCPLCGVFGVTHYHRDHRRDYLQCKQCALVFVPPAQRLAPEQERAVYQQHQNDPQDLNYRQFLGRLFDPMRTLLAPGTEGLDFGSGPGPTLSVMFEEAGFPMRIYDVYYASDVDVLSRSYDFITATEVVEHLYEPGKELGRLWSLIRPGGWLGIMTKFAPPQAEFSNWYYSWDPTHVSYYSLTTFQWMAKQWNARLELITSDVILLQKRMA